MSCQLSKLFQISGKIKTIYTERSVKIFLFRYIGPKKFLAVAFFPLENAHFLPSRFCDSLGFLPMTYANCKYHNPPRIRLSRLRFCHYKLQFFFKFSGFQYFLSVNVLLLIFKNQLVLTINATDYLKMLTIS